MRARTGSGNSDAPCREHPEDGMRLPFGAPLIAPPGAPLGDVALGEVALVLVVSVRRETPRSTPKTGQA
jgi:hypothetical protein